MLFCASVLSLAACGGEDSPSTSAAPPPAATTTAAAPASSAAAGTTGSGDKEICESVKKAGEDMKAAMITAMQAGEEPSPAMFKKILTDMNAQLESLAAAGGDSEVATAVQKFGEHAAKAAKAADPANAADNPDFEKAGADLTAACKPTGVNVNF